MTKRLPTKWIPVFTIGVALFFIVMLFLWDFNAYAQKQLETEVQSYAEDIQKQVVITLKKNMEVLQERIETEALIFNMRGEMTDGEIIHELEKFAENEDINRATIITTDGTIYSSELGIEKADPNLFKEALSRTETSINKLRIYEPTGQKFIDISTPVYIDNKNVGFLSVSYDHTNLQRSFKVSFLKGNCSLALITGDGTIIGRVSGRVIPAFRSENLLDFLEQDSVKFTEGSATIFRETLEQEKAAKFEYKEGDKSYFISHEPVGISDWHIATAVADGILQTQAGSLEKMASLLAFKIILLMLACMILFVWYSVGEQNRLKRLKESYRLALKKSNDLFYEIDLIHDSYTDHSEQGKKLFFDLESLKYSDLIGKYSELCGEEDRSKFLNHFLPENLKKELQGKNEPVNFEYMVTTKENIDYWFSSTIIAMTENIHAIGKVICIENDITASKLKTQKLQNEASLDGLTTLYNKISAESQIEAFLRGECEGACHALFVMDIDYLKEINDKFGHRMGDEAIAQFAKVLKMIFRKEDLLGRIGGDEFIALLKNYGETEVLIKKAKQINECFLQNFFADGQQYNMSISIGISLFGVDGNTFEELSKKADSALYVSKRAGRNQFAFFKQ